MNNFKKIYVLIFIIASILIYDLYTYQKDQDPHDTVKIQFLEEMFTYKSLSTMGTDMAIQMLAMQGASMANAALSAQGQLLASKIATNSQTLQTKLQAFQTAAQTAEQKTMQSAMNSFTSAQADMQHQIEQASLISNLELDYIYKNISIAQPAQNYIFNQIQFDQLFSSGTMLTPQGVVWKNPFAVGDWSYDKQTNSFWQYQSAPITPALKDGSNTTSSSSLQAENNAIYAEYYTNKSSYTIEGTITLYHIDYPFFAGIICNKARWISGDYESIRKCRMIGIYGTNPTNVGIYFAEQYTMTADQIKQFPNENPIQTPLQQIINGKIKPSIPISEQTIATVQQEPLSLQFTMTLTATSVNLSFSYKNHPPVVTTIHNLNPLLFMYHGIGCISPGAVTQFEFKQPSDFIFDAKSYANYIED